MGATLTALGDWRGKVNVTMQRALGVSIDVMGRTGEEACKHALILMAQSAAVITTRAKAKRPVLRDVAKDQYVQAYVQGRTEPVEIYKFQFGEEAKRRGYGIPGTWENAKKIGNRGLAKRSWRWGLAQFGLAGASRAIPGASQVFNVRGGNSFGYGKTNALSYIIKTLPASWANEVSARAANKIMGQAAQRIKRQFKSAVESGNASQAASIAPYFKAVT